MRELGAAAQAWWKYKSRKCHVYFFILFFLYASRMALAVCAHLKDGNCIKNNKGK
jgi:hypothetical protein